MLTIGDQTFDSHLLIGSARYKDSKTRMEAIKMSGADIVTVSIRRTNICHPEEGLLKELESFFLLPNTAACFTAKEAILTAELAREALHTRWIKLEVIGEEKTLYPDSAGLLEAAYELVKQGFFVLPYCFDDPVLCQKLADIGCVAIMPLASPIGSGMGINNSYNLEIIRKNISLPIIIDAGIGTASDVAICMEMGMDGVLLNTSIAQAVYPIQMAKAMRLACEAGRLAYLAGRIPKQKFATPSSPIQGKIT